MRGGVCSLCDMGRDFKPSYERFWCRHVVGRRKEKGSELSIVWRKRSHGSEFPFRESFRGQ